MSWANFTSIEEREHELIQIKQKIMKGKNEIKANSRELSFRSLVESIDSEVLDLLTSRPTQHL